MELIREVDISRLFKSPIVQQWQIAQRGVIEQMFRPLESIYARRIEQREREKKRRFLFITGVSQSRNRILIDEQKAKGMMDTICTEYFYELEIKKSDIILYDLQFFRQYMINIVVKLEENTLDELQIIRIMEHMRHYFDITYRFNVIYNGYDNILNMRIYIVMPHGVS